MNLFDAIQQKQEKIAVIGLGYVGMPIAVAFSNVAKVIGFDISKQKIELYKSGIDPTDEVGNDVIRNCTVEFTADEEKIKEAKFIIVSVPTPVNPDHTPDLKPIISASQTVGKNLSKGSIVVFESTVYPGVTEDICVPILIEKSGLNYGTDFKVGYSPERINPGDKEHRLETIIKVVSGMDEESLDVISNVYEMVVKAGTYKAESIKVAEAAKVIENSQRDINIAFMNELSLIFDRMGIDTQSVLKAAGTKWNFMNFRPGLVGGHCIGVDPYYLTYKAEQLGYQSQIILAGRRINDDMGKHIASVLIKKLIQNDVAVKSSKVAILGFTFKENCPDTRNTRVIDIVNELKEFGITPVIVDPNADKDETLHEYGIQLNSEDEMSSCDAIIVAVAHDDYKQLTINEFDQFYRNKDNKILLDIKGIYSKEIFESNNYLYWRL